MSRSLPDEYQQQLNDAAQMAFDRRHALATREGYVREPLALTALGTVRMRFATVEESQHDCECDVERRPFMPDLHRGFCPAQTIEQTRREANRAAKHDGMRERVAEVLARRGGGR